jgi:hydroxymethylpyrimidine kinase/phosphomethylpyrimidine kinase
MLGSRRIAFEVARILAQNRSIPRVIDPVFKATSGAWLLRKNALPGFLEIFRGEASLITPNLFEASILAGRPVTTVPGMKEAAKRIFDRSPSPCLIKGGHLKGKALDILFDGSHLTAFDHPWVKKDVHGTGCFLSAAILGYLAKGCSLEEACHRGIALTARGIRKAAPVGNGRAVFIFPSRPGSRRKKKIL